MATRIIEYSVTHPNSPIAPGPSRVEQTPITANGASTQSAAFNSGTNVVCVQSDETCNVSIGENPTATASSYKIQAGGEQFFHVTRGATLKVAVLR